MVLFNYETEFQLASESKYENWIDAVVESENKISGEINYIFCDDAYLHKINVEYLNHDDYTDIISFDYTIGNLISGDIFISLERVQENAKEFEVSFEEELLRVMAHGVLHYCGYKDKSVEEAALMRSKEEEKMQMFHVEQ
ncbi:rRNA maturation RNase YbeY [Myroides ceti]|uniref:Endoribonuclease YbeY n=1 Tax=Paenimyroides ceti TaxID=395087 RepID=A0ABT8CZY4_9FLAO|nr:rRNA maturation RNase YbeY [Paenimyroides ceti]MDN3708622.1 rRNA maturation RNase YbeY [Paenimyroides ceti]MDN3710489.1 rRNA maturation RNase YbeY [Paenimyroides ceti]MDN3710511.1 rRNA maturation RNase YbeY [Paenimyroides ceti]